MNINSERFIKGLQEDNPWWNSKKTNFDTPSFKRSDYYHYIKEIDNDLRRVNVITGPRRVGKTTLIKQLIEYLIKHKKINPNKILFLSLDRPYNELTKNKIYDSIEFFEKFIINMPISESEETLYIFVDEAQYDSRWSVFMKQYVDQKRNIYSIVSGSSAIDLSRNLESGAGRFHTHQMVTLKFRDVLRLKHEIYGDQITQLSCELRKNFIKSIETNDLNPYLNSCKKALINTKLKNIIMLDFEDYILKGGYPEFYEKEWDYISNYYQQNVFDIILQKDVINVFKIRHPDKIRSLFVTIIQNTGYRLTKERLAESINSPLTTVDDYVEALKDAFLIRTSSRIKLQGGYPSRKTKKYYAADNGLRNAFLGVKKDTLNSFEKGFLIETAVFNHVLRLNYHIDKNIRKEGFYYDDKDSERDIIMDIKKSKNILIPFEVKKGQCDTSDIKKIKKTMYKLKTDLGIILCEDQIGLEKNVLIIPTWIFMISC